MEPYMGIVPQDWTEEEIADWKKAMGQRLRKLIEATEGKRKEFVFAEKIGISQGSLSDILNGKNIPTAFTLLKIMQNTDISIEHILRG